ncbi:MAG: hypothetical protein A2V87_04415 [Deltaproteobacteria bacterium RBG_16_58_17]|nr:MAG: hypothetical protein A2V87_04415 [Deltaproteobacteria bacterium RBG_16_58_17]OHE18121.1 MAG: hypothetical protein A2X96_00305 [Syntrophobacterales bacterium GWC2_56_13]OHE21014.1 MAG: hypothetical protein A2X95_01145 [Syntrophobacterales bacterium GWF2_56_9]
MHRKRFWGSEIAADFSMHAGKALAAAKIQDHQYAKESLRCAGRVQLQEPFNGGTLATQNALFPARMGNPFRERAWRLSAGNLKAPLS